MTTRSASSIPSRALWYVSPGTVELRDEVLAAPGPDQVLVRTLFSGVSRGTERLVMEGRIGAGEWQRMRAPLQAGDFPFPVKYGYCATGRVDQGPAELAGSDVFVLHPHQTAFLAPIGMVVPLPDGVPARRATMAANVETALNALWDSGAGPADRIVVVGAGIVGLLVAYLAAAMPGTEVTVVDPQPGRAAIAAELGARFCTPEVLGHVGADVVFHTSASAGGLATALTAAGVEGTVVELSWYGAAPVAAPLGDAFHSQRLRLISSQVGQVATSRRPRWTHRRRIEAALTLLRDDRLDVLLTTELAFEDTPAKLPALLRDAGGLAPVIAYA
jgi:threonine dehydrogenase-like Zn-dependent dehydrogenase